MGLKRILKTLQLYSMTIALTLLQTTGVNEEQYVREVHTASEKQTISKTKTAFSETTYLRLLREAADNNNLEFCIAKAVYDIEYQSPFYVSSTGAVGVMQLMPREGSYTTFHYDNYLIARKRRGKEYNEKTAEQWAQLYVQDLLSIVDSLIVQENYEELYLIDIRFNPSWNIPEGVRELAVAYHHFEAKNHGKEEAASLAFAAYNAGIPAVEKGGDHIPRNGATEIYVPYAVNLLESCRTN